MHDSSREAYEALLQWHSGNWCLRLWMYGNMEEKIVKWQRNQKGIWAGHCERVFPSMPSCPHPPHLSHQIPLGGNTKAWVLVFYFSSPGTQTCPYTQSPTDSWRHFPIGKSQRTRQVGRSASLWQPDTKLSILGDTVLHQRQKTGPDWRGEVKTKLASHHNGREHTGLDRNPAALLRLVWQPLWACFQ